MDTNSNIGIEKGRTRNKVVDSFCRSKKERGDLELSVRFLKNSDQRLLV